MTRQEIFDKLNEVFSDVFDEDITVTEATTAADIEEWDSLTHVMLIGELETQLGISIPLDEAVEITGVKELLELCGVEE